MDTMKDTTMQPATDAVIEELRKMQPTAWVYEDMLGRKCVGFERPLHRRNTHEPLFSAATHAVVMGLVTRLEAAEKERDILRDKLALESQENGALRDSVDRACEERDALRAKIERMEKRLRLILEEPENTMSNSKAMREMLRQARLALEESK